MVVSILVVRNIFKERTKESSTSPELTRTYPPLPSRAGAEASDPVLAALPTRFAFSSEQGVGAVRIVLAVLGMAIAITGIVIVEGEELHPWIGAGLLIIGALIITPLTLKIILPADMSGKWSEIVEPGSLSKLTTF